MKHASTCEAVMPPATLWQNRELGWCASRVRGGHIPASVLGWQLEGEERVLWCVLGVSVDLSSQNGQLEQR